MKRTYPKYIGIGGPSRSGKSSLAKELCSKLPKTSFTIFDLDDFVKNEVELPRIRDRIDWESPETIDVNRLLVDIEFASINYKYIFIEGIFAFHRPELDSLYDLRFYLKISKDVFLKRRKKENRWGEEPDWYLEHVWSEYLKQEKKINLDRAIIFTYPNPDYLSKARKILSQLDF